MIEDRALACCLASPAAVGSATTYGQDYVSSSPDCSAFSARAESMYSPASMSLYTHRRASGIMLLPLLRFEV